MCVSDEDRDDTCRLWNGILEFDVALSISTFACSQAGSNEISFYDGSPYCQLHHSRILVPDAEHGAEGR